MLAVANFVMTTLPPEIINKNSKREMNSEENITVRGKFKSVDLFNKTIHIVLYPHDGLRAAVNLQEIEEGTDVILNLKTQEGF